MTNKQLHNYLTMGREIEFDYKGKHYGILPYGDGEHAETISFYEANMPDTIYKTVEEFMEKASIDGKKVCDIFFDIEDEDIEPF